jgi:biopolymer transport protein ExbB/TolQ
MLHGFTAAMKAGGVTLGIILFCSVLALAVGIERIAALWRFLDRARTLAETVKRCLYRGALAEARAACERSTSLAAEFFLVGFERHGRSSETALEAAVDRERQRIGLTLKGQLWLLATIGAIAPFIGLFGTVWGILRAFEQIGATHQAGIDVVGPGIAEALVTTAAGIVVAIEAMVIYNYFMARLARVVLELKLMAEEFVELLREQKPEPRASSSSGEQRTVSATERSGGDGGGAAQVLPVKPQPSEA